MDYWPLVIVLPLAIVVPIALMAVQRLLAPRLPNKTKLEGYECGAPILGSAHPRMPIKFYLTAVLFLLFDIEVVFLFPWAASFKELGGVGLATMLIFLGVLEVGLLYVWRKGALEWE